MSGLENMIDDNMRHLLKFLSKKDKISLRSTSSTLLSQINELENIFKVWRIRESVDKNKLRTIADINIIQELEIHGFFSPGCGPVFKYLVEKHEEMETISIVLYGVRSREDEEDVLLTIFSNINLRSVNIYNMWNTYVIIGRLPSTLPNLEKLVLTGWRSLSDLGLVEILNRSRSNLRELDLHYSNITGVGVEEGVNSLPNLEVLKLDWCFNLTDGGFKEILRVSGCKLCVLDVSCTLITGQGFKEGVSLPMLEELDMGVCGQLTDSGLQEILSITGIKLKTVWLCGTRISTAVRSTLCTQYPSVQFIHGNSGFRYNKELKGTPFYTE